MKRCEITALERRRSKIDLVEAYKIITGMEAQQCERFWN